MQIADALMGGKVIQLVYAPVTASQALYKQNDMLPTTVSTSLMASVAGDLMPKIDKVATQADSLLYSVRLLIERKEISNSLGSIENHCRPCRFLCPTERNAK